MDRIIKLCVKSYCYEDNFRRIERAEALAREKGLTLPQVALAYVLSQPLNAFALIGCKSRDEFADNIAAMEVKLTPEKVAWLELKSDEVTQWQTKFVGEFWERAASPKSSPRGWQPCQTRNW